MLKLIDSALGADVLHALASMGHGDELIICDTNFPADTVARSTTLGKLLHMSNVSAPHAVKSILALMPLDTFVEQPALRMEIVGKPNDIPPVQAEVQAAIDGAEGKGRFPMGSVERMAFYERAKKAYAVVRTGERRFYGCFVLKKGVVAPEA
jgi:L-fucose mutarotase